MAFDAQQDVVGPDGTRSAQGHLLQQVAMQKSQFDAPPAGAVQEPSPDAPESQKPMPNVRDVAPPPGVGAQDPQLAVTDTETQPVASPSPQEASPDGKEFSTENPDRQAPADIPTDLADQQDFYQQAGHVAAPLPADVQGPAGSLPAGRTRGCAASRRRAGAKGALPPTWTPAGFRPDGL